MVSLIQMKILVCNSGSSSLKLSLFKAEDESLLAEGSIDWATHPSRLIYRRANQPEHQEELGFQEHGSAIARLLREMLEGPTAVLRDKREIKVVAHRVVHGGQEYTSAVHITPEVERVIGELSDLAPVHNPASLEVIRVAQRVLPAVPHVAVFDTAFHRTIPAAGRTYAVPLKWTRAWGVQRFGFHGLSHAYCAVRAAKMLGRNNFRLIVAHLGNGASVSAIRNGKCVDTSMGFTPLEGVVMGSRSGSIDPGLLIYLLRRKGLRVDQLSHALNYESGLLGISGFSKDMRQILDRISTDPDARLALEVYVHRLRQAIGGMAATLGGVDALVFTAGVGENSAKVRELACENLRHLGLELDPTANARCKADVDISTQASPGRVLVITTREDLTIVRETKHLLRSQNDNLGNAGDSPATSQAKKDKQTQESVK
jgi:acetate kinase